MCAVTNASVPSSGGERASDAMMDMEPRTDISPQITDTLLKQMSDTNWKERKEAVETVEGLLQRVGAPSSVAGIIHTLPTAIRACKSLPRAWLQCLAYSCVPCGIEIALSRTSWKSYSFDWPVVVQAAG